MVIDIPYTPKTVYQDDFDNREFLKLAVHAGTVYFVQKIKSLGLSILLD